MLKITDTAKNNEILIHKEAPTLQQAMDLIELALDEKMMDEEEVIHISLFWRRK